MTGIHEALAIGIVSGVLSGFIASFLFHKFLHNLPPNIVIGKEIATYQYSENGQELTRYCFKFINRSKRDAFNLKMAIMIVVPERLLGGTLQKQILIEERTLPLLKRYNKKDQSASYAAVLELPKISKGIHEQVDLSSAADFFTCWNANQPTGFAKLLVTATDSYSGRTEVFSEEFGGFTASIKSGRFVCGNSFDIK